jgi:predicted PurR-regulated permease PerM
MLPMIPQDKANHFIYGCLIYFVAQFFIPVMFAFFFTATIAIAKELYDHFSKKGNPESLDAIYTIAGCLPLYFIQTLQC